MITESSGNISTAAGTLSSGYSGNDILATAAALSFPEKVAFYASGNMYISDTGNRRIRKVTAGTGMISTVAGTGAVSNDPYVGEGGLATSASIQYPIGVAIDTASNLYFADYTLCVVRKVTPTGATPPSSTATQSSSTTHFAQTLHLTIVLLSSLLILHLCRDA